ncbi:ATP-dependent DNA ligase [Goodfellowiella coeruleoviolacea]|uniref:DNA ligase (ATP) n=2 Tax=Goodfellowiella coeruleoviolacea TaxID=334858 RepID=A0AAE3GDT2_9PSEU|nr:ATP-dependent DNA ligase [Goodfellowiella coeruleoviolacea]
MLATSVPDLFTRADADSGAELVFEPKWDGFRCLVFRDGAEITLQSRNGKPLNRYFPEVLAALPAALPDRVVLDGELVVARQGRLDFDALSERIHPAASRVRALAERTPANYVAFDLLATAEQAVLDEPTTARRQALLDAVTPTELVHLTPATTDIALARSWFELFEGAGLDGVVGKPAHGGYTPGRRTMVKVKHARTADCVVAGVRWQTGTTPGTAVGSLLLGLYDHADVLHHVGVVGAFPAATRRALADEFGALVEDAPERHPWLGPDAGDGRRLPGPVTRWRSGELPWMPLRLERVVEVAYDHTEGGYPGRFRHTAQFVRWRPDREVRSCRYDQLDEPARYDLAAVLRGQVRPSR